MSQMEEKVLSNLALKLGISQSKVLQNASELSRLASLRSASSASRSLSLSGSAKSVICLELAASSSNIPVDKACAFRLSGMPTKKSYQYAYKTFECLLGRKKSYSVHDLAIHFGVSEVSEISQLLLRSYQDQFVTQIQGNLSNTIFAAAALYTSCRLQKVKIDKSKVLALISAKRSQFDRLTDEMNKIAKDKLSNSSSSSTKRSYRLIDRLQEAVEENCRTKKPKHCEDSEDISKSDDYEEWKKKILLQAAKSKSS